MAENTAGEIVRWSTKVGGVTVNFAVGHVRDLQKESRMMQKAPAVQSDSKPEAEPRG